MAARNEKAYLFTRSWDEYERKWKQSFNTGVTSLISHFGEKKRSLNAPMPIPVAVLAAQYHR